MKQFLDFIPILLFVVVYFATRDIFISTAVLMAGVTAQVGILWVARKPISRELKFTFWVSIVMGTLTLAFRDETFIQWKPTIMNWAFAGALIGARVLGNTNLIARLLGKQMELAPVVWDRLNSGWALGFFLAGALNLVVAYNFSMDFWVSYKLIGGFAITLLYLVITMIYLVKGGHLILDDAPQETHSAEPARESTTGTSKSTGQA